MNSDKIKQEIIWRYKFIYENIKYIIGPFIQENEENILNEEIVNKNIPRELLKLVEEFLLGDGIGLYSELVKYVEKRKHDEKYVDLVNRKMKNDGQNDKLVWELLNSLYQYIVIQEVNSKMKNEELRALDEYYKILRYENNEKIITTGSNMDGNFRGIKKFKLFNKKIDKQFVNGKFTKYVADSKNYNLENDAVLTEKEKQEIYLTFHDEMAWDTKVKCEIDKLRYYKPDSKKFLKAEINPPCEEEFYLDEKEMFINPNETFFDYYQMCPNCGYVVAIPHAMLSTSMRMRIEKRCLSDETHFRSMLLKAELKSLDYRDDILVKKRKR